MEEKKKHGGARPGSGRRSTGRNVMLSVRVSAEAAALIGAVANKSEYIDNLIRRDHGLQ